MPDPELMNLHLVKTRYANAIVAAYDDDIVVFDVASRCHRQVLGFVEEQLERPVTDVTLVVCTHDDPDHIGGTGALADLCGASIALPHASGEPFQKLINDPFGGVMRAMTGFREGMRMRSRKMYFNPERDAAAARGPQFSGTQEPGRSKAAPRRLRNKDTLPGFSDWLTLHTPGHSWDSCCYFHEASGSLITGDTLLGSRKRNRVVTPAIYANRQHFRKSMELLKALPVKAIYPGHGNIIAGDDVLKDL